ncbi:unnamed protein product, partial [Meganyctiphanes norvegica]
MAVILRLQKMKHKQPQKEENVTIITEKMVSNELAIYELMEGLGPSLTHSSPSERCAGTQFVADSLHALPKTLLGKQEIAFIMAFCIDRLKDQHSVIPSVIYALLALVEQANLEDEEIQKMLRAIFKEVHCQSQIMTDRRNLFTLFKYCVLHKIKEIEGMGSDFILGFISSMDGEKDPRNLVLLFSIYPMIAQSVPVGPFTEDLFEVAAAYFPIDFVPPTNDPFGISADDLIFGLRQCLSSSPFFAPYCIPLLQEKLDSDLTSAKLDSLHTIVSCCEIYSSEDIRPHINPLWASIRREVIEGASTELEQAALSALHAVMLALHRGTTTTATRETSNQLTNFALMECLGHLTAPEQRLMFPSASLLLSLVSVAEGPANTICSRVIPLLIQQFKDKKEDIARKNTILILGKFLSQASKFPGMKENNGCLCEYETECWEALKEALQNSPMTVQEAAVGAITIAFKALTEDHLNEAARIMTNLLILSDGKKKTLRNAIINSFIAMHSLEAEVLNAQIMPDILLHIQENSSPNVDGHLLECLSLLTLGTGTVKQVLPVVWNHAEAQINQELMLIDLSRCCQYLNCAKDIISNNIKVAECLEFLTEAWNGIYKCIDFSVKIISLTKSDTNNPVKMLEVLSALCRILVSENINTGSMVQSMVSAAMIDNSNTSSTDLIMDLKNKYDLNKIIKEFNSGETFQGSLLVYVYEGLLMGLRKDIEILNLEYLLAAIRKVSLISQSDLSAQTAAILHASLINKLPVGPSLEGILSTCHSELCTALENPELQLRALNSFIWLTKALVIRGHTQEALWVTKLETLLAHDKLGLEVAQRFQIIVKDHSYAFTTQCFPNIRLLYKQRFFEAKIGILGDIFSSSEGCKKQNAMLAVASLLPCLPSLVLRDHMNRLLPILLQGLQCSEATVLEGIVGTLASLLDQSVAHAAPHISTLMPRLLNLTKGHQINVRIKSLECLKALSSLPSPILLPYKNEVVRGLRPVLNDHKRVVRQTATTTRCAWVLVGSPGTDIA